MKDKRFFVDQHTDGEWYLVPLEYEEEWTRLTEKDWRNDLSEFQVPEWAVWLEFGVATLTFTDPVEL